MDRNIAVTLREFFDEKFGHIDTKLDNIDAKIDTVTDKQDITNGRVRKAEAAIAVLQWGYGLGAAIVAAWFFNHYKS